MSGNLVITLNLEVYRAADITLGNKFNEFSGACPKAGTPQMDMAQKLVGASMTLNSDTYTMARKNGAMTDAEASTFYKVDHVAQHLANKCKISP